MGAGAAVRHRALRLMAARRPGLGAWCGGGLPPQSLPNAWRPVPALLHAGGNSPRRPAPSCPTNARWGLDFVWPYLLHYPRDKIGVIDEVCVFHPPTSRAKGNTLYHVGELLDGGHCTAGWET